MHDRLNRLAQNPQRWLDGGLGVAIATVCSVELAFAAPRSAALTIEVAAVGTVGVVAVVMRRRWPLPLALAFSAACFFPGLVIGARWRNAPADSLFLSLLILAFTVGAQVRGIWSVLCLIALCVGSGGGSFSDPAVLVVFTVPAWAAGTAIRSRAQLTAQLAERAHDLDREREAFAREAVRYERARIARDLHDVVAHNLSMIVVQAGAGRRALASDPATAAESLRHIQGGAAQARREIAQLTELLGDDKSGATETGLQALDELVQRATATGLAVSYVLSGDHARISPTVAGAVFHVTQEGVTNALRHAPGAPIKVAVHADLHGVSVTVENGPPHGRSPALETAGGGHGIAGLRDRVAAAGGDLRAGATTLGGWRISVALPSASVPADHPVSAHR